jgi:hypothetical protein
MGWTYEYNTTRSRVIKDLIQPYESERHSFRTLRHTCVGSTLFAVHESTLNGKSTKFIGVYLLAKGPEGSFGYKGMDETMGPYQYACPLSYLDMVDEPMNENSANWREKVRGFWEQKKAQNAKRPQVGEIWTCHGTNCKKIRIARVEGRRIEAYNLTGPGYYRIPKKLLGEKVSE